MASPPKPAANPAAVKVNKKPANRLLKPRVVRNPHPPPPPKEYQFQPGQSGNPSGRPKAEWHASKLLSEAYLKRLQEIAPGSGGRSYADMIASGQITEAMKGGTPAAVEIRKTTEGDMIRILGMSAEELYNFLTADEQLDPTPTPDPRPTEGGGDTEEARPPHPPASASPDSGGAGSGSAGEAAQ